MKTPSQPAFRFGDFLLVPDERLLLRAGEPVPLTGRAYDLLTCLVRQAGHLLTKDELLATVWPGVVVEEVNLSVNISVLRKALGQTDDGTVRWIETVPRQGYRFSPRVAFEDRAVLIDGAAGDEPPPGAPADTLPGPAPRAVPGPARRLWLIGGGAVVIAGAGAWTWQHLRGGPPPTRVAVLPLSGIQTGDDFVADGLADALINRLSRNVRLVVTPRASAFGAGNAAREPVAAGRTLGSAMVVSGRIAGIPGARRLQIDLMDVARDSQVWGANYPLEESTLPTLAGRIALDLERALGVAPAGTAVSHGRSPDPRAYLVYLQGRYYWNLRSESALRRAAELFGQAIEIDPSFAQAHAGLADTLTAQGYLGHAAPSATFPRARPLAQRALELEPAQADAHASLAYVRFYFDWDWNGAEESFAQALAIDPDNPVTRQWHAVYLLASGRAREAFEEAQRAHRRDPLSLAINTDIGFHHYYSGRYREAIEQLESVVAMKGEFLLARLWLGRALLQVGRHDEALAQLSHVESRAREWPVLLAARGYAFGVMGRVAEARAVLEQMRELAARRFVTAYGVALVHAGLGDRDATFEWLERAFDERSHWLVWLRLDPRWARVRDDARFAPLVARMNYPV